VGVQVEERERGRERVRRTVLSKGKLSFLLFTFIPANRSVMYPHPL